MTAPRALALWIALAALCLAAAPAAASPKEAAKHFSRGVALYNEADYRAALVEFERAYELAPNPSVLFNIGQTHFQLQSYAAALVAFERYLAEAPPNARHRADVEQSVETLRARVGRIDVQTTPPGAEVLIDDESAGTTPLPKPVLVGIGRRKVTAVLPGAAPQTRLVDVAAGDTVKVALELAAATGADTPARREGDGGRTLLVAGWTATGVLGAAALTTGALAFFASRDLDDARGTLGTTRGELDDKSTKVTRYALATDLLGAATLVVGGITLYATVTRARGRGAGKEAAPPAPPARTVQLGVGRGLLVRGTF